MAVELLSKTLILHFPIRAGYRRALWRCLGQAPAVTSWQQVGRPAVWAAGLVIFAACAAAPQVPSQQTSSSREADAHATAAGIAMTNKPYEEPSSAAAFRVVGHASDTTIVALSVTGTTWRGSVVLQVTVARDAQLPQPDQTVRCYRFLFDRSSVDDARPRPLSRCPDSTALTLSSPPPGPDLSSKSSSKLAASLTALSTDHRKASAVMALLSRLYPAPAASSAEQSGPVTVTFRVSYENACLLGELPAHGGARVAAAIGTDCRGG